MHAKKLMAVVNTRYQILRVARSPIAPRVMEDSWSFYAHTYCALDTYNDSMILLGTVTNAFDWAAYFRHIVGVDYVMSPNHHVRVHGKRILSYSFFKNDIRPSWEDVRNSNGYAYHFRMEMTSDDIVKIWKSMNLDCILGHLSANGIRIINKINTYSSDVKVEAWFPQNISYATALEQLNVSISDVCLDGPVPVFTKTAVNNQNSSSRRRRRC
jgi:hypothetical protein